jgi:plasmid stability protein
MADILVRNLKPETVRELKRRAVTAGRSVQSEVRQILETATCQPSVDRAELMERFKALRSKLAGRKMDDSRTLIREGRGQ